MQNANFFGKPERSLPPWVMSALYRLGFENSLSSAYEYNGRVERSRKTYKLIADADGFGGRLWLGSWAVEADYGFDGGVWLHINREADH